MMFLHRDVSWSDNRKRQRAHNHPSTHTHDRHPSLFSLWCTHLAATRVRPVPRLGSAHSPRLGGADIVVDVAPGGVALLPLGHEAPRSRLFLHGRRRRRFSVVVGKKKRGEFCRFALPYDCREECNANTPQGRTARPPRRTRRDSRETCGTLPYAHMERELDAWTIRRARETRCVRRVAGARGISAVAAS